MVNHTMLTIRGQVTPEKLPVSVRLHRMCLRCGLWQFGLYQFLEIRFSAAR